MKAIPHPPLTDAQRRLVTENEWVVNYALTKWPHLVRAIESASEAVSIARVAMCEAARRLDHGKGKYSTYALSWIHGLWKTAARGDGDLIRIKDRRTDFPRYSLASLDALHARDLDGEEPCSLSRMLVAGSDRQALDPLERDLIAEALARLSRRERQILTLRFESHLTFPQIGTRLRTTRQRAHQVYQRALAKLRRWLRLDEDGLHLLEVSR